MKEKSKKLWKGVIMALIDSQKPNTNTVKNHLVILYESVESNIMNFQCRVVVHVVKRNICLRNHT